LCFNHIEVVTQVLNDAVLCEHLNTKHNRENCKAALTVMKCLGLPLAKAASALANFEGLPHRCHLVSDHNGIRWINDSKATNIGSAMASIESIAAQVTGNLIWIAGGDSKGADMRPLAVVVQQHVNYVVLFGRDAPRIASVLKCDSVIVTTLEQAVNVAKKIAQRGDTVLLAPACASLDQFENYQERGKLFANLVRAHSSTLQQNI